MSARPHHVLSGTPRRILLAGLGCALTALALFAVAIVGGGPAKAARAVTTATAARSGRKKPYCIGRIKHHCVKVPKAARRPVGVDEQGPDNPRPDTPDAGGVGGGGGEPGEFRTGAVAWATEQLGRSEWHWYCERFAETAFGQTDSVFASAAEAQARLQLHTSGTIRSAPAGSLVYFAPDVANHQHGHVGISLGHGRMISALKTVTITNLNASPYWRQAYVGWADAPTTWPGRIPPAPVQRQVFDRTANVIITAPSPASIQSGTIALRADAGDVGGVAFDAYYASNPAAPSTRAWHAIGLARSIGNGGWELSWNTMGVPDQGDAVTSTVNVAAIALTTAGQRTNVQDYRRIVINNSAPAPPPSPPTTTPSPPPGSASYPETTGGVANTWSNPQNAGGTQGPTIQSNQTVQIACRLTGYQVQDGNTWWYRIAESPWSGQYYVSADAFYNNGQTTGSLHGTPFFDPSVPIC